jgi:hypothetical protein
MRTYHWRQTPSAGSGCDNLPYAIAKQWESLSMVVMQMQEKSLKGFRSASARKGTPGRECKRFWWRVRRGA